MWRCEARAAFRRNGNFPVVSMLSAYLKSHSNDTCASLWLLVVVKHQMLYQLVFFPSSSRGFTATERSMTQQQRWRVVETAFVANVAAERERHGHQKNWWVNMSWLVKAGFYWLFNGIFINRITRLSSVRYLLAHLFHPAPLTAPLSYSIYNDSVITPHPYRHLGWHRQQLSSQCNLDERRSVSSRSFSCVYEEEAQTPFKIYQFNGSPLISLQSTVFS